jgi:hypothetical protein
MSRIVETSRESETVERGAPFWNALQLLRDSRPQVGSECDARAAVAHAVVDTVGVASSVRQPIEGVDDKAHPAVCDLGRHELGKDARHLTMQPRSACLQSPLTGPRPVHRKGHGRRRSVSQTRILRALTGCALCAFVEPGDLAWRGERAHRESSQAALAVR